MFYVFFIVNEEVYSYYDYEIIVSKLDVMLYLFVFKCKMKI